MRKEVQEFNALIKNVHFNGDEDVLTFDPIPLKAGQAIRHNTSSGSNTTYITRDCVIVGIDEFRDVRLSKAARALRKNDQSSLVAYAPAKALPMDILQKVNDAIKNTTR